MKKVFVIHANLRITLVNNSCVILISRVIAIDEASLSAIGNNISDDIRTE